MERLKVNSNLMIKEPISDKVYKVTFTDTKECWYEKYCTGRNVFADIYEKFASDVAKILCIKGNDVRLILDNNRSAVMIKSFLNGKDAIVHSQIFLKQYDEIDCDIADGVNLYTADDKCVISKNIADLEFIFDEIRYSLENMKKQFNAKADIDNLLKNFSQMIFLDYLLGNSKRNSDKWGIIIKENGEMALTPSYDNEHILYQKYVQIHGLNVNPETLIRYLITKRYGDVCETILKLYRLTDGALTNLLVSYKDVVSEYSELDVKFIKNFVQQRIATVYKIQKEYISETYLK